MPPQIYFGDTSSELDSLRPVLVEQISQAGMQPVWMTDEDKQSKDVTAIMRRKLNAADAFVGIVTFRRGWEPEGHQGHSLSQLEIEAALQSGKPVLILLPNSISEMGMYLRLRAVGQPPPEMKRQHDFWEKMTSSGTVTRFTDEADLTRQISDTLKRWSDQLNATVPAQAASLSAPARLENASLPLDVEAFAEQVATRTAAKVQAVQRQREEELAEQALKYNEALRLKPGELVFGKPSDNSQFRGDIFMIMPFAAAFTPIYRDVVQPLVRSLNLTVTRGDEFTSTQGVIMEEVWSALNNCRFVIADITGGNDNVFYELGIAHTLNKPAILITQAQHADDIPFDIRHLRYLKYENTESGRRQLGDALKPAITRLAMDLREGWGD